MEYVLFLAIIISYSSLAEKISKISDATTTKKSKKFPSLKELIGKTVKLTVEEDKPPIFSKMGILKAYDEKWLVIETEDKKNKKELLYYRIKNVTSIDICD